MWKARDDAVWGELERSKNEAHEHTAVSIKKPTSARAATSGAGSSAQGNSARAVYSAKFYDDVAPIQREMDEQDAGIVKPSCGDRLVASCTRAYDRGDIEAAQGADKPIEKHQAKRREARARKKERKAKPRDYVTQVERDRVTDPPSDNDRS